MIINHFTVIYFLYGVVCTLLAMCIALWIASVVLKRKIKKKEKELDELPEMRRHNQGRRDSPVG